MVEDWTLQVVSRRRVATWTDAAQRLRALLDVISRNVEKAWGAPLVWRDEDLDVDAWRDVGRIADEMVRQIAKDEGGATMDSLGSSGVVQGYKDLALAQDGFTPGVWDVNVSWSFGDVNVASDCKVRFGASRGKARPLDECDSQWLAVMTCEAAHAVGADTARVFTRSLLRALNKVKRNPSFSLGAVSYAHFGVDASLLPDSFSVFDCSSKTAMARSIVADLHRVVGEPESVAEELVKLENIICLTDEVVTLPKPEPLSRPGNYRGNLPKQS